VVDACRVRGDHLRNGGDFEGAVAAYEEILALDPHDDGMRLAIARARLREDREGEGTAGLDRLANDHAVPRHVRDRALEDLADLALQDGRGEEAAKAYRTLAARTLDEDALRTLEVKIAAAGDERLRPGVVALLIGPKGRGPDRAMAMELLGKVAAEGGDGLPGYLLGRQYVPGNYEVAARHLDRALALPIGLQRVRVEAERLRLLIACATLDTAGAARFYAAYAAHPEVSAARRGAARALAERCGGIPAPGETKYDGSRGTAP
jgi:tetratricopeptide (TPR) repeat protein